MINLSTLPKREIVWMATHKCGHGHTYITHPKCYEKENPSTTRLGFFDIECSNLDADFGIILSYCFKNAGEEVFYERTILKEDIELARAGDEDRVLMQHLLLDLQKYDIICGYYSSRFDVPYIRTRAKMMNLAFPGYGELHQIDLYDTARHKLKLSSNRLENVGRNILGVTEKTRIDAKYWRAGARGDTASLAYIADHNRKDVTDLEKIYNKVIAFRRPVINSV